MPLISGDTCGARCGFQSQDEGIRLETLQAIRNFAAQLGYPPDAFDAPDFREPGDCAGLDWRIDDSPVTVSRASLEEALKQDGRSFASVPVAAPAEVTLSQALLIWNSTEIWPARFDLREETSAEILDLYTRNP